MSKQANKTIRSGLDYLTTVVAQQRITVPGEHLGGAKEDFDEMVTFVGAPLNPPVGNADTIMERLQEIEFEKPVKTRLAAFANVSAAPIRMQIGDDEPIYFDLYVTLSPTEESPGETIYRTEDGESGVFESQISLSPLFELRPLGKKGESIFIDTGKTPIPGFPMRLGATGGTWSRTPATKHAVRSFGGESLFYHGEVLIEAFDQDGKTALAACAKQQAEFLSVDETREFERVDFPTPGENTNIELQRWRND